ncbi:IclR family transcriptional regulator [Actinobacteria bacterium YIM 96077]|uniref:Glycerol operon regulatory protein n=1 Tax=Phytoactinopolyspora halophila TaxID=1981511 RepID=A0A329QSZ5_9ACTN|nr:IclR family transcriptional regulator [Phytoactinopolyspora halophila]AYY14905.1 IclR family transcriptional regulator [Actinobacteria bacterium YIM 96077]RAW15363.1 IclR family transcriptional regulator [Phytoactinopolyspora halophila]
MTDPEYATTTPVAPSMPATAPTAGSKTLDNGVRLLKTLARHPRGLTMTDLATALGVHRTGVYRLLGTLTRHGLVTQTPDNRYRLGLAVIELSGAVRPDLQSIAHPVLRELADHTDATAFLSLLDGDDVVSTLVVEPLHADAHVAYRVGTRHPATRGSAGMAILGALPPRAGEREEIAVARERGYSVSQGEIQRGAWGLAAPVRPRTGTPEASVGVVALQPLDEDEVARLVIDAAGAIGALVP